MKSEENSTSPFFQVYRVAEIDDALVVRIGHGEGNVNASSDALVGSGRAELFAVEDIGTGGDVDSDDPRMKKRNG